jgi:hypothetical protein
VDLGVEDGERQPLGGEVLGIGMRQAGDEPVAAQPGQVVRGLGHRVGGAEQPGHQGAQAPAGDAGDGAASADSPAESSGPTVAAYRDSWKLEACPSVRQRPAAAVTAPQPATPAWLYPFAVPLRCAAPLHQVAVIARVLAIPPQAQRQHPDHLPHRGRDHRAPGRASWTGRRGHAPLMLACRPVCAPPS